MTQQLASLLAALAIPCLILVALLSRRWTELLHRWLDPEPLTVVSPAPIIAANVVEWRRAWLLREAQIRYDAGRHAA